MKGITGWQYKPYTRLIETERATLPFICRLAPFEKGFELEWFDRGATCAHELLLRKNSSLADYAVYPLSGSVQRIEGLEDEQDYEFKIRRVGSAGESGRRLVRTGFVPGTVVNYLHPEDEAYAFSGHSLCSPTLARLPSGRLISGMDVFYGSNSSKLTLLFRSDDNGKTWRYLTDIFPAFWPKLFVHRGKLYLFAASEEYGDMMIGRSDDEGETWTPPVRLIPGGGRYEMGPHKAPMPVISHAGRLYTAIDYGAWKFRGHGNGLLSIDENADLLDAANWRYTPFLKYDSHWPGAPIGFSTGCIEGNAVVSPDGHISNYLRIDHSQAVPGYGKAVVLRGDDADPEAPLKLDRIVDCPVGSNSKFQLYREPESGKYIMIGTEQNPEMPCRTVLSMAVSDDFYTWRVVHRLLDYRHADPHHVGFQYPDWIFDGDDILVLVRTAFGRSFDFHDANFQTFHVIKNYRQYL